MTTTPWFDFTEPEMRRSFDGMSLERGRRYAAEGRVQQVRVDPDGSAMAGVRGSGRAVYSTEIWVEVARRSGERTIVGSCSCPVGDSCKHAVAVAISLGHAGRPTAVPVRSTALQPARPAPPAWQSQLAAVMDHKPPARQSRRLALQIDEPPSGSRFAAPDDGMSRLRLRPLIQGQNGKWVKTGASWRDVTSPYLLTDAVVAQREALTQLYATHNVGRPGYYYASPSDHLAVVESVPLIWAALARVAEAGVELIDGRGRPVILVVEPVRVALDVTRGADRGLLLRVVLFHDDQQLSPAETSTIGLPVHGVEVHHDGLVLAPLDRPLSAHLRSWWQRDAPVEIPAHDAEIFLQDFAPSLQQQIPIISSDGSVTMPEVSGPMLGLDIRYQAPDQLALEWTADYRIGDVVRSVALDAPAAQVWRDLDLEASLRAAPPIPADAAGTLTAYVGGVGQLVPRQVLRRLEAARFVNEWLPALVDEPQVDVREHGDRPDLRLLEEAPAVRLATHQVAGEGDWFDLELEVRVAGERIVLAELLVALAVGESHLFLASGSYFALDRPELEQLRALLEEAAAMQDRPSRSGRSTLRISRYQADLWSELVSLGVVSSQSAAWQESVRGLAAIEDVPEPDLPQGLKAELRPYQREGYRWLSFLWDHNLGGILADDMGLGKTVQTLAMLARARERADLDAPVLVVAPASVVYNWATEARRFVPDLPVVTVTETHARRSEDLTATVAGAAMVITSYAIFRLDHDEFAALPWRALVLDEAQALKNPKSKAYQCARRLEAPFKLAITGTPLENNLMDLWAQLSIVAPGLFPSPERFTEHFRRPIEREQDAERLAVLRRRISPLMLRRTKELVAADLPPRQEQILEVELHDRHRRIYDRQLQRERQKILGLVDDLDKNRFTIFRSLTLLRQLSLHAGLVDEAHAGVPSAKVGVLLEQLRDVVAEGHRVLVFSQFTSFLRLVRDELDAERVDYVYLDGRTRDRAQVVERFRSGKAPVFLISLKAGGVGLNLTEADYVFVLDPWWNPAVEAQAVDRAHRIGQHRTVMVYRLVATGTIEEKVMALKERKAKLFDQVVGGEVLESAALTADDIRGLLEG